MFRYILQQNQKVLKGLICALLHLKPERVQSIIIQNPIDLAGTFIVLFVPILRSVVSWTEIRGSSSGDSYRIFGFYTTSISSGILCNVSNAERQKSFAL